jgi:hypothetical protein
MLNEEEVVSYEREPDVEKGSGRWRKRWAYRATRYAATYAGTQSGKRRPAKRHGLLPLAGYKLLALAARFETRTNPR